MEAAMKRPLLALALACVTILPLAAQDAAYGLESRAAIGAHHICSGLWVVGRVTKRTADEIVAQDIAPFRDFSWDKSFAYTVDEAKKTVTVRGPGIAPRMARSNGDQGCAIMPRGETDIHFKPIAVPRSRGAAQSTRRRNDTVADGRRQCARRT
jgi:hypothetical protein